MKQHILILMVLVISTISNSSLSDERGKGTLLNPDWVISEEAMVYLYRDAVIFLQQSWPIVQDEMQRQSNANRKIDVDAWLMLLKVTSEWPSNLKITASEQQDSINNLANHLIHAEKKGVITITGKDGEE